MKKVNQDPFSNGTEFMIWEGRNCDRCWKASRYKEVLSSGWAGYTQSHCAIQRDIFTRMYSNEPIAQRTIDITSKPDCPFRQEKRKRKKDRFSNDPKLF